MLAEKIETVIARGITNTRMRDFYDIYILLLMYSDSIEKELLSHAVLSTSQSRGTDHLLRDGQAVLNEVAADETMQKLWSSYQNKYSYAEDISWNEIVRAINELWGYIKIKYYGY